MKPFSLYFHIPYCYQKCPYCDFNTYAVAKVPEDDYCAALLSELDFRAQLEAWRGREIQTIYFGGGTPSLLSGSIISKILRYAASAFKLRPGAEISLEANPGATTGDNLAAYREAGVNRISFGAQSFNHEVLSALGRIHSAAQTEESFHLARSAGFENLSLDLIFGCPSQTLDIVKSDIEAAIALSPSHISAYGLTIEKGTPFFERFKRRTLALPAEERVSEMLDLVWNRLPENGYEQYEISNFAKPGLEARHNMAYWNGDDYLGIGAGAHSLLVQSDSDGRPIGKRWSNFALPAKYMSEAAAKGAAESWSDSLRKRDLAFEYFFLGLRKTAGVSLSGFEEKFGKAVEDAYPKLLPMLKEQGLVRKDGDALKLTRQGLLFSDSVLENFSEPNLSPRRGLEAA